MKRNIYITGKAEMKREGNTLRIKTKDESTTLPLSIIGNLYIFGKSSLSSGARNFLLHNNIDIYFLSYTGSLNGVLSNTKLRSNYSNRLKQFKAFEEKKKTVASLFVERKILDMAAYCTRSMERYLKKITQVDTIDELRGIEGAATLYMFKKVKEELASVDIIFEGRSYHPPKDAVNALLSFVYTLHYNFIYSVILSFGLDPYIGFLHHKRGKHAPLASDIMESQRTSLTQFIIGLFLDGTLTLNDFSEGYRLSPDKRKQFIRLYVQAFAHNPQNQKEIERFIQILIKAL
jgi:CRISPR-associated protein Cas1